MVDGSCDRWRLNCASVTNIVDASPPSGTSHPASDTRRLAGLVQICFWSWRNRSARLSARCHVVTEFSHSQLLLSVSLCCSDVCVFLARGSSAACPWVAVCRGEAMTRSVPDATMVNHATVKAVTRMSLFPLRVDVSHCQCNRGSHLRGLQQQLPVCPSNLWSSLGNHDHVARPQRRA